MSLGEFVRPAMVAAFPHLWQGSTTEKYTAQWKYRNAGNTASLSTGCYARAKLSIYVEAQVESSQACTLLMLHIHVVLDRASRCLL